MRALDYLGSEIKAALSRTGGWDVIMGEFAVNCYFLRSRELEQVSLGTNPDGNNTNRDNRIETVYVC